MQIKTTSCSNGDILPLSHTELAGVQGHISTEIPLPFLKVGTRLAVQGQEVFRVVGRALLPTKNKPHAQICPMLKSLVPLDEDTLSFEVNRHGYALAWVTLSDKGFAGEREDTSGPAIAKMLGETIPLCHEQGFLLPDEGPALQTLLTELAHGHGYDLICTTGGTGLGPRDVAVEATLAVLDKRLQGFEQLMMQTSLLKTPNAVISRAVAGIIGETLCINFPGSKKAVEENLEALLAALPHALAKLAGDTSDCGRK